MAKTGAPRGRKRQSKRLNPDVVEAEEENIRNEDQAENEDVRTEAEDKPETEDAKAEGDTTDIKQETGDVEDNQAESDSADVKAEENKLEKTANVQVSEDQAEIASTDVKADTELPPKEKEEEGGDAEMDAVIEVKGSALTVSVSWEKNEEQVEDEKMAGADDQTRTDDTEMRNGKGKPSTTEEVSVEESEEKSIEETEDKETEATEEIEDKETEETEEIEDKETEETEDQEDAEMETAASEENECEPTTTVEDGESDGEEEDESNKEMTENGKRKAESSVDSSPSKKTKLINDGYCLFVGNLDNSKHYEEIKNALASYLMSQSILVQDIRLDKAKKHAYVDLASEMDLTKALTLSGEMLLDKPMKLDKAKVKVADKVKKKTPQEVKKAKDERSLFVKNIPFSATREDVLKVFPKAIAVRFLGGTDSPSRGIAFVEFQNKAVANAARQQSKKAKIQDRFLYVDVIGGGPEVSKTKSDSNNNTKAEAPPNSTLFVSNLPYKVQEKHLKKIFKKAVKFHIPQSDGKSRGYAFVEFASVAHAEKALELSKNSTILKRPLKVQFCLKSKTEESKVLSKTLIVLGLDEKTTAETLKEAFEGALSARVSVDKDTGVSRRFGFVDFENPESCTLAKESMEECRIDGCKVTVAFARPKRSEGPDGGQGTGRGRGQNFRGGRGHRGGRGRGAGRQLLKKKAEVANED